MIFISRSLSSIQFNFAAEDFLIFRHSLGSSGDFPETEKDENENINDDDDDEDGKCESPPVSESNIVFELIHFYIKGRSFNITLNIFQQFFLLTYWLTYSAMFRTIFFSLPNVREYSSLFHSNVTSVALPVNFNFR